MVGVGYGKVILFGEHFVVYGMPGIVSGLKDIKTVIRVRDGPWNVKDEKLLEALKNMSEKLTGKSYRIEVLETVPIKQNLGSSAAFCAAFVKAVNEYENLGLSDDEVNKIVYVGEKTFHGTPSGIDNSAAVYGEPIVFQKLDGEFSISKINISSPLHLLLIDTGPKEKSTKELVAKVKELKGKEPVVEMFFSAYSEIFKDAKISLEAGDIERVGRLMNLNHALLCGFGLTTPKIEEARKILGSLGALGSKITGAGGGGRIMGLFKTREDAINAKTTLEKKGYSSIYSMV